VAQQNLPEALEGKRYYLPTDRGFERKIAERLEQVREAWTRKGEHGDG
jgi:putative ATPase